MTTRKDIILQDAAISHQIDLLRFTAGEKKKVLAIMSQLQKDLRAKLLNDLTDFGKARVNKPEWWPECPYPESVFPMTIEEYVKAIPDPRLRTAISGSLGREFWNIASEAIWEAKIKSERCTCWRCMGLSKDPYGEDES